MGHFDHYARASIAITHFDLIPLYVVDIKFNESAVFFSMYLKHLLQKIP